MSAAIQVEQVVKRYTRLTALDDVSLNIERGEFFGLLGPNGAGKTTLISAMAGLTRLDSGRIRIMGYDVQSDYRNARRQLGVVPQELVFDPFFNVRETLRLQCGFFGIPATRERDAWIDEILENLDLTSKAHANMRMLSGGMKRRVLVAQALVHKPPVIVLDEPTAGVDVELRQTLWQFIQRLNRAGHTIVLTTHYLEEAEELCGRIAMLKAGRLIALDRTAALLRRHAVYTLRFRLADDTRLPARLLERAEKRGGYWSIAYEQHAEVGPLLLQLNEAGCQLEDLEIGKPDLEDVFVHLLQGNHSPTGARP